MKEHWQRCREFEKEQRALDARKVREVNKKYPVLDHRKWKKIKQYETSFADEFADYAESEGETD